MALLDCSECGREVSDKAARCPGCGAPIDAPVVELSYDPESDCFTGGQLELVKLAMRAVQQLGWKVDTVNEAVGLVSFQTGMSWGSWSGISGTLQVEPVGPGAFRVMGAGKQNVRGGQLFALNIGNEAQGKALKAIAVMRELVKGS